MGLTLWSQNDGQLEPSWQRFLDAERCSQQKGAIFVRAQMHHGSKGRLQSSSDMWHDAAWLPPLQPVNGTLGDTRFCATQVATVFVLHCRRAQFAQVVYAACSPSRPGMTDGFAFPLPVPTVLKPEQLWTGKQVNLSIGFLAFTELGYTVWLLMNEALPGHTGRHSLQLLHVQSRCSCLDASWASPPHRAAAPILV